MSRRYTHSLAYMDGLKQAAWALGAAATILVAASAAQAAGDADNGAKVFNKCKACHELGEDAKNKVGPVLTGVIGRPAGSVEGFDYGTGMTKAREMGLVWSEDTIFEYIGDPRKFLRSYTGDKNAKAKMVFKLRKETDREDVIAYLRSFE